MAQLPIDLIKPFLPPGVAPSARPAPLPRPGFDREADPRVRDDRALGDYGYKVLDSIYKDYGQQIAVWKNAFKEVTAAYATAVGMRNKTFEEVQAERKAEAEAQAAVLGFVFSLMTAGSMVCLGAWVQYKLVPGLVTRTAKWDFSKGMTSVPGLTIRTAECRRRCSAASSRMSERTSERLSEAKLPHMPFLNRPPSNSRWINRQWLPIWTLISAN
jgi:hypothetical protein